MGVGREFNNSAAKTVKQTEKPRTNRSKSYPLERGKGSVRFPSISSTVSNGLHESESISSIDTSDSSEACNKRRGLLRRISQGFHGVNSLRQKRDSLTPRRKLRQMSEGSVVRSRTNVLHGIMKSIAHGHNHNEHHKKKILQPVRQREEARKRKLYERFRFLARITVYCIRFVKAHSLRYRENEDQISPYIKGLHFHDYEQKELMFDKSKFKAKKSIRIPEETKRILCKRPADRTPEELYTAAITLRNIKSFAQYPQQMQEKIVACGQYEKYEAKRIILRQGHPGSSYYFMLSGEAVVMVMDTALSYARPINHIEKGQDFGEIALSLNTSRKSTVITKEPCELMSIGKRDYQRIFMHGGRKSINDPDQEQFLRSLSFLHKWPIEKLEDAEEKTCFLYYKRGETIIKESSLSPWLVIVKSGSVSVLKRLKRVKPFEWRTKAEVKFVTEKEKRENVTKREIFRRHVLAELKVPMRDVDADDIIQEEYPGKPKVFKHPGEHPHADDQSDTINQVIQSNNDFSENVTQSNDSEDNRTDDTRRESFQSIQKKFLPKLTRPQLESDGYVDPGALLTEAWDEVSEMPSLTKNKAEVRRQSMVEREKELYGMEQQTRTVKDDVDAQIKNPDEYTLADLKPEFVRVQTLIKGQVFGLSDLILEQQTNFSVISNGADVILIDRQFYMKHAPERLISKLRQELCPYPTDEEMQNKLQSSVDWDAFRNSTMTTTLDFLESRRKLRESQKSLPVMSLG